MLGLSERGLDGPGLVWRRFPSSVSRQRCRVYMGIGASRRLLAERRGGVCFCGSHRRESYESRSEKDPSEHRWGLAGILASGVAPYHFVRNIVEAAESDTIKVGILHSLSGTIAIIETSLHNAELLAIEEINAKGGVARQS